MILTNLVEAVLICYIVDKDSTWVGIKIFPAKTFAIFNLTMWVPVVDRTKRVKPFLACGVPNRKVHLPKKIEWNTWKWTCSVAVFKSPAAP